MEGGILEKDQKYAILPAGIICKIKGYTNFMNEFNKNLDIFKEGEKQKIAICGHNYDLVIYIKNENDILSI